MADVESLAPLLMSNGFQELQASAKADAGREGVLPVRSQRRRGQSGVLAEYRLVALEVGGSQPIPSSITTPQDQSPPMIVQGWRVPRTLPQAWHKATTITRTIITYLSGVSTGLEHFTARNEKTAKNNGRTIFLWPDQTGQAASIEP